jgi:hypothetical protein
MAHFAQIDNNNIVTQVIVVSNNEIQDANGLENELLGVEFCKSLFGNDTKWIQTSYNRTIRKNYAGVGYFYDSLNDAFIAPKPFTSWVLDTNTYRWQPPVIYPQDNIRYTWDEETVSWKEVI